MGSTRNCSVFGCSMTYNKAKLLGKNIKFYAFPGRPWMKERKQIWIRFVKRKGLDGKPWLPTKSSLICSQHFVGGLKSEDPRSPSYNPTIFETNDFSKKKEEKNNEVQYRYERFMRRTNKRLFETVDQNKQVSTLANFEATEDSSLLEICKSANSNTEESQVTLQFLDKECGVDLPETHNVEIQCVPELLNSISGPDNRSVYFGGFPTVQQSGKIRHLTGISENVFALLKSLFPNFTPQFGELALDDKLLITLFKLKTGLSFTCISALFGVAASAVAKIFHSFISRLAAVTKSWIFLPSREATFLTLPESFKKEYSKCRLIIDCTEFKTEMPATLEQRVQMYSVYKSGYTAKYLIGITPAGFISFISNGYGGRATDAYITNDSGVLNLMQEGDIILADKGFPSVHIKNGAILVMPPFSKRNQPQFLDEDMERTYSIASVRIHVERAIQRIKTFEILTKIIPTELFPRLDDIIHVISVLVNLSSPLIKGEHNL